MDEWEADIDAEALPDGRFMAVLVFTPPPALGPAIRLRLDGCYDTAELAKLAAFDEFAAMTRRPSSP